MPTESWSVKTDTSRFEAKVKEKTEEKERKRMPFKKKRTPLGGLRLDKLSFGTAKQGMALPDTLLDLLIVEIRFKHRNSVSWSHRLLSLRDLGLVVVLFSVKNFQGQSV